MSAVQQLTEVIMIAIIALVLRVLMTLVTPSESDVVIIPAIPSEAPANPLLVEYHSGCDCFRCYRGECYLEAWNEFNDLFNSYEVKRAKNGALMIRSGNSGSFKFAKKG